MSRARAWRPSYRLSDLWRAPLHDFPIRDEILFQYLPLSRDMDVLEVGPGSGITAFRWAPQLGSLTLLDFAPGNIARLESRLGHLGNVRFHCADICKPEVGSALSDRFDAAYAIEVFELLPDPATCLNNLAALLRPGGRLLLQFPNYPPPRNPGVTYFSTRPELERLLKTAGFGSWSIDALRLRPHARFVYQTLHERPLRLYRRLRARTGHERPLVYDQSWAFSKGRRVESYRAVVHSAWAALSAAMRLGGDCFERHPLGADILNYNLLLLARR
jgi:SAM-dependent methyltransferase